LRIEGCQPSAVSRQPSAVSRLSMLLRAAAIGGVDGRGQEVIPGPCLLPDTKAAACHQ
jgi:hypothetical protein